MDVLKELTDPKVLKGVALGVGATWVLQKLVAQTPPKPAKVRLLGFTSLPESLPDSPPVHFVGYTFSPPPCLVAMGPDPREESPLNVRPMNTPTPFLVFPC